MSGGEQRAPIRVGRPDEADRLSVVARAAKASWGYPDAWIEGWVDDLRVDAARLGAGDVFVADVEDEPAGWVAVGEGPEGPEIAHLWVHPDHQGHGLGRALLEAARTEGARRGWPVLRIESDPHAVGFYEGAGGRIVGRIAAPVDGVERWLPVLELDTGPPVTVEPADPAAARLVELSEIDDRLAVARGRARRRLLVAGGMTLVGPVNFLVQALVYWSDGWRPLGPAVFGVMLIVSVGLWLQWGAARSDVVELRDDRRRLLAEADDP